MLPDNRQEIELTSRKLWKGMDAHKVALETEQDPD
jgi:hypothetical protein